MAPGLLPDGTGVGLVVGGGVVTGGPETISNKNKIFEAIDSFGNPIAQLSNINSRKQ